MTPNERLTPISDKLAFEFFNSSATADIRANQLFHAVRTLERSLAERTEERDAGVWYQAGLSTATASDFVRKKEANEDTALMDWLQEHCMELHLTLARVINLGYVKDVREAIRTELERTKK
jgi:hypothetical protein